MSERIDRFTVAQNLEMQMRTGRAAGAADESDQLASVDTKTFLDARRKFGKVTIDRGKFPEMINANPVAVSGIRPCANYDAVGRSIDRRAGRSREIDALMHERRVSPLRLRPKAGPGQEAQSTAAGGGRIDWQTLAAHSADWRVRAAHGRSLFPRIGRRLGERIGAP